MASALFWLFLAIFGSVVSSRLQQTTTKFVVRRLGATDFLSIRKAALDEFLPDCRLLEALKLQYNVVYFFGQKLTLPTFGHILLGVFDTSDHENSVLAGFVDVSLQSSSGSNKEALALTTLSTRQRLYGSKLQPYLCNLLVAEPYRRLGLASMLVAAVEDTARTQLGGKVLNLHVSEDTMPALRLYLHLGFCIVPTAPCKRPILFMTKPLID